MHKRNDKREEQPSRGLSRRQLIMTAGAATSGSLLLTACGGGGSTTAASGATSKAAWTEWVKSYYGKPVKIGVSCFETANPYFAPSKVASEDAGGQLGIATSWTGPSQPDTAQQISQFKDMVRGGYQAIVVIPGEADPWVEPIKQATDAGIIVLTANQDSPDSARELFFGQNLYQGAVDQAKLIRQLTGDKGKVAVTNCAPGSDALNKRSKGAKDGYSGSGMQVVGEYKTDPTDPAKLRSTLENVLTSHPDLAAFQLLCGPDTAAAGKLKQQKKGKFVVVGDDLLPDTLDLIKQGTIDATFGQNPYLQVYLPIMYAYQRVVLDAPRLNLPGGNYDTGTEVVTKKNVDMFITRESRFQS